jgi:hypothetical protein
MRELDAIKVSSTVLKPGRECTLIAAQPHPNTVLLSHFEVTELSPRISSAALISLRVEQLCYLLTPVPLLLLESEQRFKRERAMQRARQLLQPLLGSLDSQRIIQLIKPDRRDTRLTSLNIRWKPGQQLAMTLRNSGTSIIDEVSVELVLYSLDGDLLITN